MSPRAGSPLFDRLRAAAPTETSGSSAPRVTIVHERFTDFAGSEKVVSQLAALLPDARVVSPIVHAEVLDDVLRGRVHGGPLSHLTHGATYAHLLPVLPTAMRHLALGRPDVVVASHHAFANQVSASTDVPVVSYVHSPARWVWESSFRRGEMGGRFGERLLGAYAAAYRSSDRSAARRVHTVVANSSAVAQRIASWWDRDAVVVHPPVDTEFYTPDPSVEREDFFLVAGRMVPYKRTDLAVRAAVAAGVPLVVAGSGRLAGQCHRDSDRRTSFAGRVDDVELRSLFRRCRAVLLPGVEDFGIIPVEAQACGAPVIAAGSGGALDTVLPGVTGQLVDTPVSPVGAVDAWADALRSFPTDLADAFGVRHNAERFSRPAFRTSMHALISAAAA